MLRRARPACRAGRAPEGAGGSSAGWTDIRDREPRPSGSPRPPSDRRLPWPSASRLPRWPRRESPGQARYQQRLPARCRSPPAARSPWTRRPSVVVAMRRGRPVPHVSLRSVYRYEQLFHLLSACRSIPSSSPHGHRSTGVGNYRRRHASFGIHEGRNLNGTVRSERPVPGAGGVVLDLGRPEVDLGADSGSGGRRVRPGGRHCEQRLGKGPARPPGPTAPEDAHQRHKDAAERGRDSSGPVRCTW